MGGKIIYTIESQDAPVRQQVIDEQISQIDEQDSKDLEQYKQAEQALEETEQALEVNAQVQQIVQTSSEVKDFNQMPQIVKVSVECILENALNIPRDRAAEYTKNYSTEGIKEFLVELGGNIYKAISRAAEMIFEAVDNFMKGYDSKIKTLKALRQLIQTKISNGSKIKNPEIAISSDGRSQKHYFMGTGLDLGSSRNMGNAMLETASVTSKFIEVYSDVIKKFDKFIEDEYTNLKKILNEPNAVDQTRAPQQSRRLITELVETFERAGLPKYPHSSPGVIEFGPLAGGMYLQLLELHSSGALDKTKPPALMHVEYGLYMTDEMTKDTIIKIDTNKIKLETLDKICELMLESIQVIKKNASSWKASVNNFKTQAKRFEGSGATKSLTETKVDKWESDTALYILRSILTSSKNFYRPIAFIIGVFRKSINDINTMQAAYA